MKILIDPPTTGPTPDGYHIRVETADGLYVREFDTDTTTVEVEGVLPTGNLIARSYIVEGGRARFSEPLKWWHEHLRVDRIGLNADGKIMLSWYGVRGREYLLQKSVDGQQTWHYVGTYYGEDAPLLPVYGGTEQVASFRVWSRPITKE